MSWDVLECSGDDQGCSKAFRGCSWLLRNVLERSGELQGRSKALRKCSRMLRNVLERSEKKFKGVLGCSEMF